MASGTPYGAWLAPRCVGCLTLYFVVEADSSNAFQRRSLCFLTSLWYGGLYPLSHVYVKLKAAKPHSLHIHWVSFWPPRYARSEAARSLWRILRSEALRVWPLFTDGILCRVTLCVLEWTLWFCLLWSCSSYANVACVYNCCAVLDRM